MKYTIEYYYNGKSGLDCECGWIIKKNNFFKTVLKENITSSLDDDNYGKKQKEFLTCQSAIDFLKTEGVSEFDIHIKSKEKYELEKTKYNMKKLDFKLLSMCNLRLKK